MNLGDPSGLSYVLARPPKTRWPAKPQEKRRQAATILLNSHYPPLLASPAFRYKQENLALRMPSEQNHVEFFSLDRNSTFTRIIPPQPQPNTQEIRKFVISCLSALSLCFIPSWALLPPRPTYLIISLIYLINELLKLNPIIIKEIKSETSLCSPCIVIRFDEYPKV